MTNHLEVADLMAENARLRSALAQFVCACDTAPPTSLMIEIGMACEAARSVLFGTTSDTPKTEVKQDQQVRSN
jgi:hypothetical protein